jgi:hypothetical protein
MILTTSTVMLNGKQAEDMLEKLRKRSAELGAEWKKFSEAGDLVGMKKIEQQMKSVDKTTQKLAKETLAVEKVLKNLSGASLDELRTAQRKLNAEMSKMDRNSAEFKQAAQNAALLQQEITKSKVAMGQWRSPMDKMLGTVKGLLPAFGFGAIVAGAKMAFGNIVSATDTLGTKWDMFTGGLKEGMNEFWRTIASGDWSNFIGNMEKAIEVGRNYQAMLDEIEEKQRALTIIEADYEAEILQTEQAVKNATLTNEERIAAAERRIKIEEELAEKRKKLANDVFQNELSIAVQQTKLSKDTLLRVAGDFDSETKQRAKVFNQQREELKKLRDIAAAEASQTGIAATESPRMKQLQMEMDATGASVKIYADYLVQMGNATDDQLNKVTDSYAKMLGAENSALAGTKKVRTSMYSLIDETNREIAAEYDKASAARKKQIEEDFKLAALLEADIENQKAAINKYFSALGDEAFDNFIAAIEKSQAEKKIDFSIVPEMPVETEQANPTLEYDIQKYKETHGFKLALNQSMYEQGLIGEKQYQDQLTELTRIAEDDRFKIKQHNIEKAAQMANLTTGFVTSLMNLELEKAGDNEEKKAEIRKKYADLDFAVTAAQIITDTAGAIMKGFSQLGPIGGAISAALLGATGLVQLGVANAQRKKVKGFAKGKYPIEAEDGKTYDSSFAGKPKTGFYDGPQLGIFNEVPGQEEMVIDGVTTRNIRINAPEIMEAIFAVRDGRVPRYAKGKYNPSSLETKMDSLSNIRYRFDPYGIMGADIDKKQNEILSELVTRVGKSLDENTKATNSLRDWKPSVSVEMIEKGLKDFNKIQQTRGL